MTENAPAPVPPPPDLLRGGLLFRLLRRFGVDIVEARHTAIRAMNAGVFAWAPMAALCLADGTLLPGKVGRPFLFDIAAHVRALITIPLLLAAEPVLAGAWRTAVQRLVGRGIVPPEQYPALESAVDRTLAARDWRWPEVVSAFLAALVASLFYGAAVEARMSAWHAHEVEGSMRLSAAGFWYALVVLGGGAFLVFRWVWRIVLWHTLLAKISRIPLHLSPVHPDRACGLEFLGRPIEAYAILTFAYAASMASRFANQMVHEGAPILTFAAPAALFAGVVLLLLLLPTAAIFASLLIRTRRDALVAISSLAADSGDAFLAPRAPGALPPPPQGPALQDVFTAVDAIRATHPVPLSLTPVIVLLGSMLIPGLVLVLLEIPVGDILDRVAKLLL